MSRKGGFGHETPHEGATNDWITPKYIIDAFNGLAGNDSLYFDLDPCSSMTQPWSTAKVSYNVEQNGLSRSWFGNVYCNPPYGPHTKKWIRRLIEHGNGIALIYARVETKLWQHFVFPSADGFLFPLRRITFYYPDGTKAEGTGGAPSAFVAYGKQNRDALITLVDTGVIEGAFLDRAFYTGSLHYVQHPSLFEYSENDR